MARAKKGGAALKDVVAGKAEPERESIHKVRVRAITRGYNGEQIRNPGEVFLMDVADMAEYTDTKVPKDSEQQPLVKFDAPNGKSYGLPSWVELVGERERVSAEEQEPKGHKTSFRPGDDSVI